MLRIRKNRMKMNESKAIVKDAKKIFMKLGACSSALFFILNREFGYPLETEARAAESLAGGIMQQGYQCGMLWGAVMAVGVESFRRNDDPPPGSSYRCSCNNDSAHHGII